MAWTVTFSLKAHKQYGKLPLDVRQKVSLLIKEICYQGPIRGNWKNYGKLGKVQHHCHLKSGRRTYVACWETIDTTVQLAEIYYVGTHEKAPY